MESAPPNLKPCVPGDEAPELDLYTIPFSSSWFSWDSIHKTERSGLREFFDGSSYSRSPKIYKEYRDFIISKHREDPSRKLTFTDVRKSLVGDVSLIRKVFLCLESWGLINFFNVPPSPIQPDPLQMSQLRVVEDGLPIGVKVVVAPNSLKPMPVPPPPLLLAAGCLPDANAFNPPPPLASFSDVFNTPQRPQWTEPETLLLLESVLKHGDDWDLVAHSVHTKTISDCILRLIEMPFGDLMLGSHAKVSSKGILHVTSTAQALKPSKDEPQETDTKEDASHEQIIHKENGEHNGDAEEQSPLPKKRRVDSSDPDRPLMEQVALISDMVGPKVKAAAVGGAVSALCNGNPLLEQIFYAEDVVAADGMLPGHLNMELHRPSCTVDLEIKHNVGPSGGDEKTLAKDAIPLPLRMRAAVATSLGTAAARARLMANQEVREMEFLVALVIETQLKKLQSKVKHFEELEHIMEKEHDELQELKECVVAERIDILKEIVSAEISR